jgi:hypothetical protein
MKVGAGERSNSSIIAVEFYLPGEAGEHAARS